MVAPRGDMVAFHFCKFKFDILIWTFWIGAMMVLSFIDLQFNVIRECTKAKIMFVTS